MDITIGERILLERYRRHMSEEELAELVGVSPATISHYEHGDTMMKAKTLEKICNVLQIPLDQVFSPKDEDESERGIFGEPYSEQEDEPTA